MALNATIVFEIRNGGSSSNGGGFRGCTFQSPPTIPTVNGSGAGGTVAANTYYIVITYGYSVISGLQTPISPQQSVTVSGTTSSITVTSPADPGNGATWNCYVGTTSGGPYFPQGTSLAIGSNRVITTTPPTTGTQPAGTDRTLQTAAQVVIDNSTITATTAGASSNVLTFSGGYTPTGADVGNIFKATGGTNINVGWYEITAITSTTWTVTGASNLTTASGAGSAITGNMGGAVDHPATLGSLATVVTYTFFVKYNATPYPFGNAGNNVSGGVASNVEGFWVGYDVTRTLNNTDANRPICRAGAGSLVLFTMNGTPSLRNFVFDNPSAFTGTFGLAMNGTGNVRNCQFTAMATAAITFTGTASVFDCEFVSCGSSGCAINGNTAANLQLFRCIAKSCTATAGAVFLLTRNISLVEECIAVGTTGNTPSFAITNASTTTFSHCVAYGGSGGSGAHGFSGGTIGTVYKDCVAYGNTGWGFTGGAGNNRGQTLIRCASGGNTLGSVNSAAVPPDQVEGLITLTGDPFTNAAGYDFSTNTTAGAGAAIRGLTVPFPGGTTTSYPDAGAVQHADPAIQAGPLSRVFTGM